MHIPARTPTHQPADTLRAQPHRLALVAMAALLASGCSVLQEDKIDYRSARQGNALEVPPDLTQLPRDTRYATPGSTVSATGYQSASQGSAAAAVAAVAVAGHDDAFDAP